MCERIPVKQRMRRVRTAIELCRPAAKPGKVRNDGTKTYCCMSSSGSRGKALETREHPAP